jgi:hypothetical protein
MLNGIAEIRQKTSVRCIPDSPDFGANGAYRQNRVKVAENEVVAFPGIAADMSHPGRSIGCLTLGNKGLNHVKSVAFGPAKKAKFRQAARQSAES